MSRSAMAVWMLAALLAGGPIAQTTTVRVHDAEGLRAAVRQAKPGTTILLSAGEYSGGYRFENVAGEPGRPIMIAAAEPHHPPVFKGGAGAMHFSDAVHLELRDLVISGAAANGLNLDDGGTFGTPSHHVVLRGLRVSDIGARGNEDGVKLSGVDDVRVEGCTFERWGAGGSAIDMVGCHRGVVEDCRFRHREAANAVQMKGGSSGISVRKCRFEDAGARAVNIGGSTGLEYFRPPLGKPPYAEARDIRVEGNTFLGSDAPVAFVGADGAAVRYNTIYRPRRWALRILQETTAEGFVPCRNGEFSHNIVVFRSDGWSEGGVNIGPGTDAASFKFDGNVWYCVDDPSRSRPSLPSDELNPTHGTDPLFADPGNGDFRLTPESPVRGAGAERLAR